MGRIDDAISKLKSRDIEAMVASPRGEPSEHRVDSGGAPRGKFLRVDLDDLERRKFIADSSQRRKMADEYRAIKRPLLHVVRESRSRALTPNSNVIAITSAMSGEGKTFTAINLALSIAQEQDWNVVLIDGDSDKRDLTRTLGAEGEPGLVELLNGSIADPEQCVMPTSQDGLLFLPAGKFDERAAELMASARMEGVIERLSRADSRRILLFDSGPLLQTGSPTGLIANAGQVILVVLANVTRQSAVIEAAAKLDSSKAVSLLLNGSTVSPGGYLSEYYGGAGT